MSVFRIHGIILFAWTSLAQGAVPGQPTGLRVNYAKEPVIDTPRPLFSWIVNDADRGEVQTAYQLRVATSRERCDAGQGDLWDTGRILSSSQADIPYGGAELASRQSCWWQVRTWDQAGQEGEWSAPAAFEMALLKPSDWTARWIGGDYQRYRTEVNLPADKTVVRARAYISAKEIFDLTLNGQRVGGDRVMEPGESVFAKRMRYCTYDVTSHLRPGANAIGMEIGRGRIGHWWLKSGDREFILQLEVFYQDGGSTRIVSDKGTWKATTSGPRIPLPPNKSELYQGETYDARLEDGWGLPGFDDRSWTAVAEARPADYSGRLVAQTAPPMKRRDLMKAVAVTQPWPGVHVFDFGQKISGWSQLSVKGPRGATVTLRHGDKLYTPQTWADYTLTLNAKIIKGAAGIRFRVADADNFYLAQLSTNGMLTLSKKVKGAWIRLKDVPAGVVQGKTYAVKIQLAGETIKTSLDGKLLDTTVDNSFGSGKVGFWQQGEQTAAFDHISVEPASGFDLSRGNKYSLAKRSDDPGFWINRDHLKTVTLPKKKPEDNTIADQFVLTDNETMMSYDGGLTGQVDQSNTHVFNSRYFADSTERYTLKGGETEVWEPQFTLHGFRYVEVTGYPGVPTVENIQARPAHGAIDEEPGSFACSNELLNKLHSAFVWTFKSSAQFGYCADYGRDERTGWVANNSWGEFYNFDILNLYDSWLTDFQDTQLPNGKISRVAPFQDLSEIPVKQEASTIWLASYLTQPWDAYTAYGSKELLKKRYESMKKLVDYLRTDRVTQNIDSKGKYANWATQSLRPSTTFTAFLVDPKLAATAVLYQCVGILAKMAKELGYQDDAEYYAAQGELIKTAFNGKFLLQDKTYVGEDSYNKPVQTALALALDMGLCPESARENVVRSLIDNIRSNDMHLTTGVCGTRSLLSALCDNGQEEIAYKLATQTTFPSWGKWILDGHTTCCEHWDGHLSSDIYYLGGSLDAYFYKYLAGIAPTRPGYEAFRIKPHVKNDLTNVVAVVNTVRGAVRSEWRRPAPGHFVLKVSVPANAKAMVHVPRLGLETAACRLTEGGTILWDQGQAVGRVPGVNFTDVQGDYLVWAVGSGDYCFELLPLAAVPAADQPKAAGKVKAGDADKLFPDKDGFYIPSAPYLYDPISKDVGDPTILFNHETGAAWVFYTQRDTMKAEGPGWYHGCDIGMQSSQFGGFSWVYRGTAEGLNTYMPGRNTFWAPEVVYHDGVYHMYVTFHIGVPMYAGDQAGKYIFDEENRKSGGILHYTSTNLIQWTGGTRLKLEPDNGHVIDAGVHPLRDGTWRMWYRAIDNARKALLCYADSKDLYTWENKGIAVTYDGYAEGPCVFFWKGCFWMLLDGMSEKYRPAAGGLAVLKSADAARWEFQPGGLAYDPTTRPMDGKPGHCSVAVQGERAFVLYHCFVRPGNRGATGQVAELLLNEGKLSCKREFGKMRLDASKAPRFRGGKASEF